MTDWAKRAQELFPRSDIAYDELSFRHRALQLGREMANEARENERDELKQLAHWLEASDHFQRLARATIEKKPEPKTREEALEAALRAIRRGACVGDPMLKQKDYSLSREDRMISIADRALEWKL